VVGRAKVAWGLAVALSIATPGAAEARREALNELLAGLAPGIGARAGAMGDAFVAVADDATALFWNPAGLAIRPHARELHWATVRHGSSDVALTDLGTMFDAVNGRELGPGDFDFLAGLADDRVFVGASAMAGYRSGRWAFGAFTQALTASDVTRRAEDRVRVTSWGMDFTTVGVAYADSLTDRLHWGVEAGRLFSGCGWARGNVVRHASGRTINQIVKNTEHASTWTANVGLLYLADDQTRVGLVGRNIISPELDFPGAPAVTCDPSFDLGVAWADPEQGLTVSADLHNLTGSNYVNARPSAGLEKRLSPSWLARVGVDEESILAGVGLEAGSFRLDLGFGVDPTEHLMLTVRTSP